MVSDLLDDEGEGRVVVVEGRAREDRHHLTRPPPIGRPQIMIRRRRPGLRLCCSCTKRIGAPYPPLCVLTHPPLASIILLTFRSKVPDLVPEEESPAALRAAVSI